LVRIELAEQALALSADCADAWVLLAEESAMSLDTATDYYRKAVAAGERAIGPEAITRDKGYLWGILESRALRHKALTANKHVPVYLSGHRKMPKLSPPYITLGDKDEAIAYVMENQMVWRSAAGAIPWLLKGAK